MGCDELNNLKDESISLDTCNGCVRMNMMMVN